MSGAEPGDPYAPDARWARRAFARASSTFDAAAVLQSEVRDALLGRLELTALEPRVILDLGAGTGHGARALKRRYPAACVLALDSAPAMLRVAARRRSWWRPFARICADAAQMPFKDGSIDLVLSNWMLPWCDPDAVFGECRRVLALGGLLSFTSLGPDTLKELRAAWGAVDAHPRVHRFIDMHDLGDALVRAGFAAPVLDVERYSVRHTDVRALAADLKALGMHNAAAGRTRGLTTPRKFAAMQGAYEAERREGRLPATYEVVFGAAWAPAAAPASPSGERRISLTSVREKLRARRQGE